MNFPPPFEFGAPLRYTSWRGPQLDGLMQISSSHKRFRGITVPTGGGKSLLAFMLIAMHGGRGLILTDSLGLMSQYWDDLTGSALKVAELRGMSNYPCPVLRPGGRYSYLADSRRGASGTMCDAGPCRSGLPCELRERGCPYFDAEREAARADVVVSNYSKRVVTDEENDVLGSFDWLILDELHASVDAVGRSLRIDLDVDDAAELLGLGSPDQRHASLREWGEWARVVSSRCTSQQNRLRGEVRLSRETHGSVGRYELEQLSALGRLGRLADRLAGVSDGNWIVTRAGRSNVTFEVVWPGTCCERVLFRDVENVVGLSATARPKTLEYLGLKPDEYDFFEQPSTFPLANRPVYVLPLAYVQWNMTQDEQRKWLRGVDLVISKLGAGRRVLADTVSYKWQEFIVRNSTQQHRMIAAAGRRETAAVVEYFFGPNCPEDAALVGPQFWGGYDFKGRRCELALATKLMFPDSRDPLVAARSKSDPEYRPYTTMQRLVQFAGRVVRTERDRGMTVIGDSHALRFLSPEQDNRRFAPRYFLDALQIVRGSYLPQPLKKIAPDEDVD